ncbi:MAG TPA: TetR/AcrR family transcriptional regulator [Spirochaetota bacterium]|nr:MAG: Fatty acid metabolism regulator protein [Firmicutes bacterium ADurb.Bin248]HPI14006.1 TetR/AcrR family transcriptional regulator [Spirochaetota bacterium]HPO46308.1 TetR/AcrR family transcriptional regulator [Spirochaetota bacterium]
MRYADFKNRVGLSREAICAEIFAENRESIRIKKRALAVRNLVTIFDATLALANERGFHAMSLRDLGRATGLSMGALYSYFSGKEGLLDMIQEQGARIVARVLSEHIDAAAPPAERLRQAVRAHLYLSESLQPWFYFSYMEARYLDRARRGRAIEGELYTEAIFAGIIGDGVSDGSFAPTDPLLAASLVKALLQDWYLKRWKYTSRRVSVEGYSDFIIEFIEAYLGRAGTRPGEKQRDGGKRNGSDRRRGIRARG